MEILIEEKATTLLHFCHLEALSEIISLVYTRIEMTSKIIIQYNFHHYQLNTR